MALIKLQGNTQKQRNIYYEFDSADIPLGEGGMGEVYKGRCVDERTGYSRNVAVKKLKAVHSGNPYVIEKARREAFIRFKHENLVEMLGFIETETRSTFDYNPIRNYYVVSELLQGVSLDDLLKGRFTDQKDNYIPFAEKLFKEYQQNSVRFAIRIVKSVLSGLMFMHDAGYIHRDIDPTNIMITSDGRIKLIDYGVAKKIAALTTNDKLLSIAGDFMGKPEYASPEQILGEINNQNQATDIYSVGILLFQCVTGHIPFEGERVDIIRQQLNDPLPLKKIKNRSLCKVLKNATEKKNNKRIQSAAEFRYELEKIGDDTPNPLPVWKYAVSAVVASIVISLSYLIYQKCVESNNNDDPPKPSLLTEEKTYYKDVVALLNDDNSSKKGFDELKKLSKTGNDSATFLLSRIYFESNSDGNNPWEIKSNEINRIRDNVKNTVEGFETNQKTAHELLHKTIEQNEKNYQALFELGLDYWGASERTDAVKQPDADKAEEFFDKALELAETEGKQNYVDVINQIIPQIKEIREFDRLIEKER